MVGFSGGWRLGAAQDNQNCPGMSMPEETKKYIGDNGICFFGFWHGWFLGEPHSVKSLCNIIIYKLFYIILL